MLAGMLVTVSRQQVGPSGVGRRDTYVPQDIVTIIDVACYSPGFSAQARELSLLAGGCRWFDQLAA